VALPAFARRTPLLQQLVNISCPLGPGQQTCGFAGVDSFWTRQTDGHRTVSWTLLYMLCCDTGNYRDVVGQRDVQYRCTVCWRSEWPRTASDRRRYDANTGARLASLPHQSATTKTQPARLYVQCCTVRACLCTRSSHASIGLLAAWPDICPPPFPGYLPHENYHCGYLSAFAGYGLGVTVTILMSDLVLS